ncbi:MAG: c-type cytochrome [Rhodocyclales bacterium]|nr:c-type cytochrome [Rhodocyclales bacterium]
MITKTAVCSLFLSTAILSWGGAAAADAKDESMRQLASKSGCFICHGIELDAKGPDGMKPVGPPWKAVAARYRGNKAAVKTLTAEVMGGTSPYNRHWKEESSGVAMPPNGVSISEADAKRLVDWILTLK